MSLRQKTAAVPAPDAPSRLAKVLEVGRDMRVASSAARPTPIGMDGARMGSGEFVVDAESLKSKKDKEGAWVHVMRWALTNFAPMFTSPQGGNPGEFPVFVHDADLKLIMRVILVVHPVKGTAYFVYSVSDGEEATEPMSVEKAIATVKANANELGLALTDLTVKIPQSKPEIPPSGSWRKP